MSLQAEYSPTPTHSMPEVVRQASAGFIAEHVVHHEILDSSVNTLPRFTDWARRNGGTITELADMPGAYAVDFPRE